MNKNPITKSDALAIICGVICLVWGIFCFYAFHVSMDYFYIPQLVLCLVGLLLTGLRFFRKGKGLTYKEYEWIPLILCIVYYFVVIILGLILPWDLGI